MAPLTNAERQQRHRQRLNDQLEGLRTRGFDPSAEHTDTHAHVQWKGTDLCMDFTCECGESGHFDGFFAYAVKCTGCGAIWEMPTNLFPRRVDAHDMIVTLEEE